VILKGMREPVEGFEVVREAPVPGRSSEPGFDARRLQLVGREDELDQLEAELARARDGALRTVLIVGEPGVGKTRLANELAARHDTEVLALAARAYPLGATASLGLWAEGLERYLRGLERSEVVRVCAGDLHDLAALLPSARAAKTGGDTAEPPRIRLLGALARLLGRLSATAPVVIVLDDVHLADGSSWEAVSYLTRNLLDCRILLLLAARPAELAEDRVANDVLLGLEQEGLLRRLTITALPADDVRVLAESVIGKAVPEALVTWLMERARGSPLFVMGLLRALVDENADLEHPALRSLPEDLAERVQVRLMQLDAPARAALELMTVVGYRAELSDLVRLSGKSLDELAAILERLVRARLVSEVEQGREVSYEIGHPLIQEAIYRGIGAARRRALHRHAARMLVESGRLGAAAPHFVHSAEPGDDEAIDALCGALRQAEGRQHHREALALLDALVELVPAGDRRWETVLGAMPVQPEWVIDHRADASAEAGVQAMRAIDQVMERSSNVSARAAVKFNLGSLLAWTLGEVDEGRRLVGEARDLFEVAGDARETLLCANELGYLAALGGDLAGHEARARAVLEAGVEIGDQLVELQSLSSLAWALLLAGQLESVTPVIARGVMVAREGDKAYRATYLVAQQGCVAAQLGRMDEARSMLADGIAGNQAFRDTYLLEFSAVVSWLAGDLSGVVSAFRDQLASSGGLSRRRAMGAAHAVIALTELGRFSEADDVQASVDATFAGRDWWVHSDLPRWASGVSSGLQRRRDDGLPTLRATIGRLTRLGCWSWARFALADLAEGAADTADSDAGTDAERLAAADPWPSEADAQRALRLFTDGAAALSRHDQERAAALLEPAADTFARVGWRLFEGRALALLGRALAGADRTRAVASLQEAAARFDTCNAVVRRDRALATLGRLGTRGRRIKTAVAGPGALTRREREVAGLAARGCSARDIAEQLFIGERTVETHLANAYAKLGVSSRVELVRLAPQLEL
jgi:DNA-binding CsgD family transcriptional regulator